MKPLFALSFLLMWSYIIPAGYADTAAGAEAAPLREAVSSDQTPEVPTAGEIFQRGFTELVQETGIENPFASVKKTAEDAARSLGRSLGQYIRGQYQQKRNDDILSRFEVSLAQELSSLHLTYEERRHLVQKIQDQYIQDAESGKLELDQQHFRDLPKVVKKEYAEIELARTVSGNKPTYDLKGNLKTLWTVERGMLHGPAVTYYKNGEIKYIDVYENGLKVSRKKYDAEGRMVFEQAYDYKKPEASAPVPVSVPVPVPVSVPAQAEPLSDSAAQPENSHQTLPS